MATRPLSPDEKMQYAQHVGGGLHSALQLYHMLKGRAKEDGGGNVLKIKVPREKLKQSADANHQFMLNALDDRESGSFAKNLHGVLGPFLGNVATQGLGAYNGFKNEHELYDKMESGHLQKQLDHAEKEYLRVLSQIKTSSATPRVDSFVRGVLKVATSDEQEIAKMAETDPAEGALRNLFNDAITSRVRKPFDPAINFAKKLHEGTLLSSAIGTFLLRQKLQGQAPQSTPTRIEIDPV